MQSRYVSSQRATHAASPDAQTPPHRVQVSRQLLAHPVPGGVPAVGAPTVGETCVPSATGAAMPFELVPTVRAGPEKVLLLVPVLTPARFGVLAALTAALVGDVPPDDAAPVAFAEPPRSAATRVRA